MGRITFDDLWVGDSIQPFDEEWYKITEKTPHSFLDNGRYSHFTIVAESDRGDRYVATRGGLEKIEARKPLRWDPFNPARDLIRSKSAWRLNSGDYIFVAGVWAKVLRVRTDSNTAVVSLILSEGHGQLELKPEELVEFYCPELHHINGYSPRSPYASRDEGRALLGLPKSPHIPFAPAKPIQEGRHVHLQRYPLVKSGFSFTESEFARQLLQFQKHNDNAREDAFWYGYEALMGAPDEAALKIDPAYAAWRKRRDAAWDAIDVNGPRMDIRRQLIHMGDRCIITRAGHRDAKTGRYTIQLRRSVIKRRLLTRRPYTVYEYAEMEIKPDVTMPAFILFQEKR